MKVSKLLLSILVLCLPLSLLAGCGSITMRGYLVMHGAEVNDRVSLEYRPQRFRVESGDPARIIGQKLKDAGLIKDAVLFEAYVRSNNASTQLAAGTFVLSPDMTVVEIVDKLLRADAASITVTIREGWRIEQVADALATANVFNDSINGHSAQAEEYRRIALSGKLPESIDSAKYPFLNSLPPDSSFEGYLFPDTYLIPSEGAAALDLITRQLDAFGQRVTPRFQSLNNSETGYTIRDILTVASIVEREAVHADERPTIAGVYLNRLRQGIKLDADPTVQYALGYQPATGQWWKTPVFLEEYSSVDSPYNTYLYPGLPPGPIAAPGLSSILAVLQPTVHNYLYFVALPDGSGRHVFAETYEEQLQNVQKYMNGG